MPDHKVFALSCALGQPAEGGQAGRNYASKAVDEAAQFGAFRLLVPTGPSKVGPVTHWWGSPNADPGLLFLAPAVLGASYPGAVIATDAAGNVTAKTSVGGDLIAAIGPHQNPVNGIWATVQTPAQFLAAMGVERVGGTLDGDGDSDIAIAAAQAAEPFTNTPGDALDPQVVTDLVARLTAALESALPDGARDAMSSQLGIGGAIAQAFLNKYGATGV